MDRKKIFILLLVLFSFICIPVYADETTDRELKELIVENHKIYFYKERTDYKLVLEEGENSLNITAIPESDSSTVSIVGADNLEANNYTVTITVTDKSNHVMTYTIKAEKKEIIEDDKELGFFEKIQDNISKMNFKIEWLFIGAGVLLVIIAIIKTVSILKGKKIDSTMDKF